ncbi:MAG: prolyl aminopeptidase [Alphaproteobacteria bacterium]
MHRKPLLDLFPEIQPYSSGFLDVRDGHSLYWEQSGNPDGVPVLMLHGGPGAGASPVMRRFFDPDHYRIIIFDQRGCGRSTPLASVKHNSAAHLVADIEALRERLYIDQWHIFGGSWGSTLALLYGIAHPQRCLSFILRGIFLCTRGEVDWFMGGIGKIFPEAWAQFSGLFPDSDDLLNDYYTALIGDDENLRSEAAIRWSLYEGACASLLPNYETITNDEQKAHALALARIEAHYFLHELLGEDTILSQIDAIRAIPASIVQGRYDMICPIAAADRLHQAWPEADYVIVPDAGHSALDPALRSRLIEATESMKSF